MPDQISVAEWITEWCIGVVASWVVDAEAEGWEEIAKIVAKHYPGGIPGTLEVHRA